MKRAALNLLSSALGLPCWQVRWDNQCGLDMNFGAAHLEVREPRKSSAKSSRVRAYFARRHVYLYATHWLMATSDAWRLRLADGTLARRSSSAKQQDIACARLRGEKLKAVVIDVVTGATTFHFDLGAELTVANPRGVVREDDDDLWTFQAPHNRYVSVGAYGRYRTGSTRRPDGPSAPIASRSGNNRLLIVGRVPKAAR